MTIIPSHTFAQNTSGTPYIKYQVTRNSKKTLHNHKHNAQFYSYNSSAMCRPNKYRKTHQMKNSQKIRENRKAAKRKQKENRLLCKKKKNLSNYVVKEKTTSKYYPRICTQYSNDVKCTHDPRTQLVPTK